MRKILLTLFVLLSINLSAQKEYSLKSPDGKLSVNIRVGDKIHYNLFHENDRMLLDSPISMEIEGARSFGVNSKVKTAKTISVNAKIASPFYKRSQIEDIYNQLTLHFAGFDLVFRAYDQGMAYRWISAGKQDFIVKNEEATFNFAKDYSAYVPYVRSKSDELEKQYINSFENLYTHTLLSEMNPQKLLFTPLVVEVDNGKKVAIAESDLESYPGMFLWNTDGTKSLKSHFAPYPKQVQQGGYHNLQEIVPQRENYIAKSKARTNFPWRIVTVSTNDSQLADNDMVYKLASPSRVPDVSWIKPGKVAWEWWNSWGLTGVDFEAGVNNKTYMKYIDFASENGIEYVILDEGWAVNLKADLFQVIPQIDLEVLASYAKSKNVGLILWAGYYAFNRDLEKVCKHYSEMGIKGFKVDFMDRDDQMMVDFHYRAAEVAARYNLILDFHGTYKPTGLQRTYPNVINFEGVHGLEQCKWNDITFDQVTYDVTMPFIRMMAGPVDYTQGAMRNGTKNTFAPIGNQPMSQGTRCRQLAEYVIFESPLNMLCDSPVNYQREEECTGFISGIPTVWDNTVSLNGQIAQYITIARRAGDVWYLGSLTNWDARTLDIDLSFLGEGRFEAEIFSDGKNANKIASDYKKEVMMIPSDRKIKISMAKGGGYAMKIYKK